MSVTVAARVRSLDAVLVSGVALLLAMDVAGALISLSAGLNATLLDALGPQARLSAPIPMMIAQVVLVVGATRRHRGVAVPASALLAVAGVLAFMSGFYDGGYAADLTGGQRAFQIALVTAHLAVGVLAGLNLVRLLRR
ncbi:hypothetical protein [Microbispora sp. ATCC PTA-5024]|uniref:hypothetical protein n=1 Tax=Microbispora sp. ATCC PTA-5024 TaxID=316330 RepID=UPI0003DC0D2D|nr:hypothetical protein [Microbispora sp. ATCC PTA-5024]ETK36852.1 hypothetical protein MPTA5024_06575 [Microbispora sp. ATCC PTA-5024]